MNVPGLLFDERNNRAFIVTAGRIRRKMLVSRAGDVFAGKSAVACDAIKVDEA
jgi:hypothetical protein